jgi:hypothetical protein
MANVNLRNITNSFQDARLVSLASWRQASEIVGRDRGGPYVVLQEGYDPEDTKVIAEEFVLGRSGKWLSLGLFYKLPVPERRAEFIFATVAEVMQLMSNLPSKVQVIHPGKATRLSQPRRPRTRWPRRCRPQKRNRLEPPVEPPFPYEKRIRREREEAEEQEVRQALRKLQASCACCRSGSSTRGCG